MRFELTTPTLARLCSTPELRPLINARFESERDHTQCLIECKRQGLPRAKP